MFSFEFINIWFDLQNMRLSPKLGIETWQEIARLVIVELRGSICSDSRVCALHVWGMDPRVLPLIGIATCITAGSTTIPSWSSVTAGQRSRHVTREGLRLRRRVEPQRYLALPGGRVHAHAAAAGACTAPTFPSLVFSILPALLQEKLRADARRFEVSACVAVQSSGSLLWPASLRAWAIRKE